MPVALKAKGVARAGYPIFHEDDQAGFITSGTMVPYWHTQGEGLASVLTDDHSLRGICLALVNSDILEGQDLEIEMRGRRIPAVVVPQPDSPTMPSVSPFSR